MPIPVLDGGQFVYFAIEAIFGRPVPERFQQFGFRIGLAMLGMLMIVAIFNDLTRLF
jgi:regulator of sigma E protease